MHPLLGRLNPTTLAELYGETVVWLSESGKEQREVHWLKTSLKDYLRAPVDDTRDGRSSPFYLSENETLLERWNLIESLRKYVAGLVPRTAALFERSAVWLGHPGTRTGLHADPDGFNLLCQIWGSKRVWLLDAPATRKIILSPRFDGGARTTDVDFWDTEIPELSHARKTSILLRRGDILYVPRWH